VTDSENYYRQRIEEEMAAAEQAGDPSISSIHREMARRYRDMLDTRLQLVGAKPVGGASTGGAFDDRGATFG
jgi:hypothetical protein